MATIPAFFIQLEPRERNTLLGGTIVLMGLLGYFFVWEPFTTARQQLDNIITVREQDLQWMRQAATQIQQLRRQPTANTRPLSNTSLLAMIDSSARKGDLAEISKRIEPEGDAVRVTFQRVRFTHLMQWLAILQAQQGVQVQSVTIERETGLDQVQVRLVLAR